VWVTCKCPQSTSNILGQAAFRFKFSCQKESFGKCWIEFVQTWRFLEPAPGLFTMIKYLSDSAKVCLHAYFVWRLRLRSPLVAYIKCQKMHRNFRHGEWKCILCTAGNSITTVYCLSTVYCENLNVWVTAETRQKVGIHRPTLRTIEGYVRQGKVGTG
jgi:hypothetical protein